VKNTTISKTLIPVDNKSLKRFKEYSTSHTFKKGDYVFQAGTKKRNFYLLINGRVKLYRVSDLGKEVTQWFCFPGEAFGLSELQSSNQKTIYAQCSENSEVLSIPLNQFSRFLKHSPDIALQIIEQLSVRLKIAGDTLLNITSDDVRTRLIKLLARLNMRFGVKHKNGNLINITLTHKEIADMIGACRQSVTTALGELKDEGYIQILNHQFLIPEIKNLETLTCNQANTVDNHLTQH